MIDTRLCLVRDALAVAIGLIVHEHELRILHTAIGSAYTLKRKRRLYRSVCQLLPSCTHKRLPILVQATQEELRLVVPRDGEAWQCILHLVAKGRFIALLKLLGGSCLRII